MKVLIVGSGGREHAIATAVAKSSRVDKIYCAPGNAGIAGIAECVSIGAMEFDKLVAFAKENEITFINLDELIVGDVNFDGQINEVDYSSVCKMSACQMWTYYAVKTCGDIDRDGAVDTFDAIVLDMIINGTDPSKQKGDANGDGVVDINDYELICRIAQLDAKLVNIFMLDRADLNNDGAVDTYDMICMDLYLNGLYEF